MWPPVSSSKRRLVSASSGAAPEKQTDGDGGRPLLPRGRPAVDARDRQDEPVQRQDLVRKVGRERQDREESGRSGGHGADDAAAHSRVMDQPIDEVVSGILRVSLAEFPDFDRDLVAVDIGQDRPRESDIHGAEDFIVAIGTSSQLSAASSHPEPGRLSTENREPKAFPIRRNTRSGTVLSFRGCLERSRR
jgi:hypothetical protein